jgi:hypothetical protein
MASESHDSKYLPELMAEKDSIDASFVHAVRLITKEIETIQKPFFRMKMSINKLIK